MAQPLERQFAQIPGVAQMTSTSSLGTTAVTIQFDLNRNIDGAANDVQAAINAAGGQLPKNLPSPPTYRKVNPADSPILLLSATSDTLPLTTVDDAVDAQLAQQISQISGVAQVTIGGQQKPAIRIQIDPAKLVAKGLSLEDVRAPDRDHHRRQPEGQHRRRDAQPTPSTPTTSCRPRRTGTTSSSPTATAARCASATSARPSPGRKTPSRPPGPTASAACSWSCSSSPAPTSSRPSTRSRRTLPQLEAAIPPAIKIDVLSDRTQTIRASVEDVQFTLLLTIALVVMVIFVFLRSFWATIIPSVTVPLALLGACALMWVFGYSLDNLSLMALTIAVGFVVDDAIVMLENITRHIEEGETPFAAALKGAGEIGFTIVSISLSLVAVLIPLLLMGGIIGRLFREFAVTLAMTIFVSLLVSLTLTPMMASRFLRAHERDAARPASINGASASSTRCCTPMSAASTWRCAGSSTTLCSSSRRSALSVYLFVVIPKGFFPQQDTGLITGHVGGRPGHLLCRHEAPSGRTRQDRAGRSRRRQRRDGDRRQRRRAATTAACSSR